VSKTGIGNVNIQRTW